MMIKALTILLIIDNIDITIIRSILRLRKMLEERTGRKFCQYSRYRIDRSEVARVWFR